MKFHVKRKVWIGFLITLVILTGLWYYSILNNRDYMTTSRMVSHANEVLYHIERSRSDAFEIDKSLWYYLTSGDSSFYHRYFKQLESIREHYLRLQELTRDNPIQQSYIDTLRLFGVQKYEHDLKLMKVAVTENNLREVLSSSASSDQFLNGFIGATMKMREIEEELRTQRIKNRQLNQQKFNLAFTTSIVVTVAILVIVFITINNSMKAQLEAEWKTNQINQELEAFTYSVSHDLRAPLRSINGYSQVLEEDYSSKLDAEGVRVIHVIMRNAQRMGKLIDDLLEFSRYGKKELSLSEINMMEVVESLVKEHKEFGQNHSIEFQIHPLQNAKGDVDMMRQVWTNLISNAVKYSSKKPVANIEIGSISKNGQVNYFVKDNGVGFDMQYANKLFKVFQRLHKIQDFEGTGVGLAIVGRIISRHGGTVWAEAKANEGATFYFSLPT